MMITNFLTSTRLFYGFFFVSLTIPVIVHPQGRPSESDSLAILRDASLRKTDPQRVNAALREVGLQIQARPISSADRMPPDDTIEILVDLLDFGIKRETDPNFDVTAGSTSYPVIEILRSLRKDGLPFLVTVIEDEELRSVKSRNASTVIKMILDNDPVSINNFLRVEAGQSKSEKGKRKLLRIAQDCCERGAISKSNPILLPTISNFAILETGTSTFGQNHSKQKTSDESVALRDLLREIGDKFDCRFTMEVGLRSGDQTHSLAYIHFRDGQKKPELKGKSLKQLLESLRKTVPNLNYRFSADNPKIIHVIDARLSNEVGYALDNAVDDISFEGYVFDFVNAIGQKGVAVSSRGFRDTREMSATDDTAHVRVKAPTGMIVRSILTNYLNLSDRGRVLWIAETELGKNRTTYVRYLNRSF